MTKRKPGGHFSDRSRPLGTAKTASPDTVLALEQTRFIQIAAQVDTEVYWSLFPTEDERAELGIPIDGPKGLQSDGAGRLFYQWLEIRISGSEFDRRLKERIQNYDVHYQHWRSLHPKADEKHWQRTRFRDCRYDWFLQDWQDRFQLPNEWCRQCARRTISRDWPGTPKPPDDGILTIGLMEGPTIPRGYLYDVTPFRDGAIPGSPETKGWVLWAPESETWVELEARVLAAMREKRDQAMRDLVAERPTHVMETPQRNSWNLHWLAAYVIGRQLQRDIAFRYFRAELAGCEYGSYKHITVTSRVNKAVLSAARDIQLTLPDPKETRKRKRASEFL